MTPQSTELAAAMLDGEGMSVEVSQTLLVVRQTLLKMGKEPIIQFSVGIEEEHNASVITNR
jgi:hypothetical protein